jgi:hypothetical protein
MHKANRSDHGFALAAAHTSPYLWRTGGFRRFTNPDFA